MNQIATVESIEWHSFDLNGDGIAVNLKPSSGAKADTTYTVDLYESGRYRDTQSISWDASELQTYTLKTLVYYLPDSEFEAYEGTGENPSNFFSVKIYKPNEITTIAETTTNSNAPIMKLVYPKGGEVWHVGESVIIKWTSTNWPKTDSIKIIIETSGWYCSTTGSELDTEPNNGSYKWVIPTSVEGNTLIGNNFRIRLAMVGNYFVDTTGMDLESQNFTITN